MTTLAALIAPQRSTQYAALADALAPHELQLSALGASITHITPAHMAGHAYLMVELSAPPSADQVRELGTLAMTGSFFDYHPTLGGLAGPFLRPIDTGFAPALSPNIVMARRYRGKTNELFTRFLCNIARFSSDFAPQPWDTLRVFDPLAGGGTTLFSALVLGADVAGVEKSTGDVETTAAFIQQYAREEGIACQMKEERLKKIGRRWWFSLGKESPKRCLLACGDTAQSVELLAGFKRPHLIVADLPYGIQHDGELTSLLARGLPAWTCLLEPGGVIALAWDATRFARADLIATVETGGRLTVLNDPPYNQMAHRVDRVIKRRDVLVARRSIL